MCNTHNSTAMCHFVPSYILKHIAESEAAPDDARQAAIRTLSADQDSRDKRIQALQTGEPPIVPQDSNNPAAKRLIVSSGFVPPDILQHIGQSELADSETQDSAKSTLASDSKIRKQRAALVGPAATDEAYYPDAKPFFLNRAVYDGKNSGPLPGALAREEGSERLRDRHINNVYDGVGITVKFFHTVFGRNGIDGNGGTPVVTVHHNPKGKSDIGYNNAFWNGTQFAFGDGDGIIFDYFTDSLDVVAHELTHAITQHTAGLQYWGQTGGLNESISDVFAAMVEQWHFNQTAAEADWLTGQGLFPVAVRGAALRNIAHPGTAFDDQILGRDKQIAHFSNYSDSIDVHHSSGIPNRAFYLIAIGFGGYSWLKAGKIWWATLNDVRIKNLEGVVTFKQWADVTVDQANTLFGIPESIVVRNAWESVGVLV